MTHEHLWSPLGRGSRCSVCGDEQFTLTEDEMRRGPFRIQRQRTKGWRMPEGAVYVGRPSRWGNPHRVGRDNPFPDGASGPMSAQTAALAFRQMFALFSVAYQRIELAPLRGRDLVCWCPLDQPCHADALLELANR